MGSGVVADTLSAAWRVYGRPAALSVEEAGAEVEAGAGGAEEYCEDGGGCEGVAGGGGGGVMAVEKTRRVGRLLTEAQTDLTGSVNVYMHATGAACDTAARSGIAQHATPARATRVTGARIDVEEAGKRGQWTN